MADADFYLPRAKFQYLLVVLQEAGYTCIGPTIRDGAILFDYFSDETALPKGVQDEQAPGRFQLKSVNNERMFSWATGPQALKPFLFQPRETLWVSTCNENGTVSFRAPERRPEKLAAIGLRACDLAALYIHDRHFLQGEYKDPSYMERRRDLFVVAVNCTHPADTCFCASTGDGPHVSFGYDLALTELDDGFVLDVHSPRGEIILERLALQPATAEQIEQAEADLETAAQGQTRTLPGRNLRDALFANLDHPRWEDVAERCLACGNCSAVCPTCFCHAEQDIGDLNLQRSEHVREWDSCFTQQHSYIHGMTIRADTRTRYRQWLTHKLGSWHDQYGRSGCVGCGRCITWCPVGIDLTDEAHQICGERDDD